MFEDLVLDSEDSQTRVFMKFVKLGSSVVKVTRLSHSVFTYII